MQYVCTCKCRKDFKPAVAYILYILHKGGNDARITNFVKGAAQKSSKFQHSFQNHANFRYNTFASLSVTHFALEIVSV